MLFGKEVNDRLSAAIDDIEEAGKCLALGRATACVLHTMRILEVGLKALANALNIPYAPSWESYLKQISDQIAAKHKNKTVKWRREEKFYRDLSGDLLLVKQAWRNPTMHIDRKYGIDEAEQIFNAAKIFMQRLANHFNEKEMVKLLKG
jgi:HEPN domain-containing protein